MDIVLRATVAFFVIFFLTRVVGRRELGSLAPFDVILLVTIGDLVQQGVTQNDFSLTGMTLAIGTIGLLTVVVSYLSWRFRPLRPVLEGVPIILVEDEGFIEKNLKRQRLTKGEVAAEARLQSIPSVSDIRWAVLEANGQISFIKKDG